MRQPPPDAALAPRLDCPCCGAPLGPDATGGPSRAVCPGCGFAAASDGRLLDALGDTARERSAAEVERFYEKSPFPGYAAGMSAADLCDRARLSPFLAALERGAPRAGPILEVGAGTAQTAAFLALSSAGRRVLAVDGCLRSLEHAEAFRARVGIENLTLLRADLFDLPLPRAAFPLVVCRGVVHHTPDPERATADVAARVAPGGLLVLGIYESFARRAHDLRRRASLLLGEGFARATDPLLRRGELDPEKARVWFDDQYRHPLERLLPLPRVAGWLERAGFEWVRTVPPAVDGDLGASEPRPGAARLLVRRLGWLVRGPVDVDNGLVCLVARRRA